MEQAEIKVFSCTKIQNLEKQEKLHERLEKKIIDLLNKWMKNFLFIIFIRFIKWNQRERIYYRQRFFPIRKCIVASGENLKFMLIFVYNFHRFCFCCERKTKL